MKINRARHMLMSGDIDFTRLAQRLREGGLAIYGFGESKALRSFRAVCHRFEALVNARSFKRKPGQHFI